DQAQQSDDALVSLRAAVVDDPTDLDQIAAKIATARSSLASSGLPPEVDEKLRNLGLTPDEIAAAVTEVQDPSPFDTFTRRGMLPPISTMTQSTDAFVSTLHDTATSLRDIVAQLDADPTVPPEAFPTVDAGGPYTATIGTGITLAASSSTDVDLA